MTRTLSNGWEAVTYPGAAARRVLYYRLPRADGRGHVGAVSRKPEGWRALGYGKSVPSGNVELGTFPTRRLAEQAVVQHGAKACACGAPARLVAGGTLKVCRECYVARTARP